MKGLKGLPGQDRFLINGRVHRQTGYWAVAVHELLRHLRNVGFEKAPKVFGFDGEGREVLEFIPGDSVGGGWSMIVSDEGLTRFAHLLRQFHDASATFRTSSDAIWAFTIGSPQNGEVMCHGDVGPWNVIWRNAAPVGLVDWDYAYPRTRARRHRLRAGIRRAVPRRRDRCPLAPF